MDSLIRETASTKDIENPRIFDIHMVTANSVPLKIATLSSSLRQEYETPKQLAAREKQFARLVSRTALTSDFETTITASSSAEQDYESPKQLAAREKQLSRSLVLFTSLTSGFGEVITASSSLGQDYESQKQLIAAEKKFTKKLVSLILDEEFEYGIDTQVDAFVREYMKQNALLTKEWINKIFIENFSNISVLVGVLRIIARLDYLEIYPQGQTMAVAALSHENTEVQECGIRAFENWETVESLQILENLKVSTQWLQEYIDEVVLYLRKEHNVLIHQKN